MQHTYKYLISLLFIVCVLSVQAQQNKQNKQDTTNVKPAFFDHFRVDLDLVPLINTVFSNGETYSYEAGVQASIKNKYFPAVEIGFAEADKTAYNQIHFNTNGLFSRVGLDFNLIKNKPGKKIVNNYFLAGVRIGISSFKYDMNNVVTQSEYWNESNTYNYINQLSTKVWLEIVAGMRVELSKNIYMGWTIRNKNMFGDKYPGEVQPWFVPGYGKYNDSNWAVNYAIGYKF